MYLKSIEVQGFKSFANKINFEFNDGITAIVGPNGSGKSNVADAVRWVLGEQSSRQLRGSSMQDVIFAGTENRKPQGYAYAALTLDNSDHSLAIDYDEVTVSRRVYRSGESEYMINGSSCRLKDVNELFYDTGIGKEGYSIIGQGQIDKILSGKPEERRELFDEAAGIVKFKKRKNIAQKKLENEKQNALRVTDILTELEKQVGPLEKQSEKAKVYLRLKEELKIHDINGFLLESDQLKEKLKVASDNADTVKEQLFEVKIQAEKLKASYDQLDGEVTGLEEELAVRRTKINECNVLTENLTGRIKVTEEQINSDKANIGHFESRLEEIRKETDRKIAEKACVVQEKGELNVLLDEADDNISKAEEKAGEYDENIKKLESAIQSNKDNIFAALNEKASLGARMQHYDTLREQNMVRKSELNQKLIELKQNEEELNALTETLKDEQRNKEKEAGNLEQEARRLAQVLQEARIKSANERKRVEYCGQEYHILRTRLESLQNIAERYEGFGNSIKRVMEARAGFPGIIGVVADLLEVPKEYETAIETALGGSIQNIVTDSEQTAKHLIGFLKKNKFGRATFLPLTAIGGKGGFSKPQALKEPGVLGLADSLVKVKGGYRELTAYLLGKIVVTDNIDHAIALAKKYQYSFRIVTLEGELLNTGGSMTGGAFKNSSNLLGRKRELEELETSMTKALTVYDQANLALNELKKNIAGLEEQEKICKEKQQENRLFITQISMRLESEKEKEKKINEQYQDIMAECRMINEQLEVIEKSKRDLRSSTVELEEKNSDRDKEIKTLQTQLEKVKKQKEEHNLKLENLKLTFAGLSQKDSFIMENLNRVTGEIKRLEEDGEILCRKAREADNAIIEKIEQIELLGRQIEENRSCTEQLQKEVEAQTVLREKKVQERKGMFDRREELTGQIGQLDKEVFRLETQKEKLSEQIDKYVEYLWNEYGLTPSDASSLRHGEYDSLAEIKKETARLKQEIKELGPVNVNAIEDYKDVSERYFFLKGQHDDLKKAEESLLAVIDELDSGMRQQFEEKFQEIKQEFDQVFKELFGGGHGTLTLVEDEDVLEAGIQIIAQPPGKKLQNMMQMSGGEKALTAICLLFAIQNLKPSPFCLLDEIEAALDDSNVGRYADYLGKLKKNTQFIVITHRRGTMVIADRLYGITMQEKGVSALVSVDLVDHE